MASVCIVQAVLCAESSPNKNLFFSILVSFQGKFYLSLFPQLRPFKNNLCNFTSMFSMNMLIALKKSNTTNPEQTRARDFFPIKKRDLSN